ncbi:MAG: methyltransferase domain-containing protein [Leptolyngbyaceae cyanobacterium]
MAPSSASSDRLSPNFWESRYQAGTTRWDLGQASPPLTHLLQQPDAPPPGKAIVLGCGRGHDAVFLAQQGFDVVGVDYAPSAIAAATQAAAAAQVQAEFWQRNIFELLPEYAEQFDYVVEHTCFCALEPALRDRYIDLVHNLLKADGQYIAVFFTHGRTGGPPYGIQPATLKQLFSQQFEILQLEPAQHSVPSRQNEEHIGVFQKQEATY